MAGRTALAILFLSAPSLQAAAQEGLLDLTLTQWFPGKMQGDLRGGSSGGAGTSADIDRLNATNDEGVTEFSATLRVPILPTGLYFSTFGGSFDGTSTPGGAISFEGINYPAGAPVRTDIVLRGYTLMLEFPLSTPSLAGNSLALALEGGIHWAAHEMELDGTPGKSDETLAGIIPMIGARASMQLAGTFQLYARLHWISTGDWNGFRAQITDATAEVRLVRGYFVIGVGYRIMRLAVEETSSSNPNTLEAVLQGWTLSVGGWF